MTQAHRARAAAGRLSEPDSDGGAPRTVRHRHGGLAALPCEILVDICARAAAGHAPRALRLAEVSRDFRAAIAAAPTLWAAALAARLQGAPAEEAGGILRRARRDPRWSAGAPHVARLQLNGPEGRAGVSPQRPALAPACLYGSRPSTLRLTGLDALHIAGGGGPCRPLRGIDRLTSLVRLDADLNGAYRRPLSAVSLAPLARLSSLCLRRGALAEGAPAQIAALPQLAALVLDRVALPEGRLAPLAARAGTLRSLGLAWGSAAAAAGRGDDDMCVVAGLTRLEALALLAHWKFACPDVAPLAALTQLRRLELVGLASLPQLTMAHLTHLGLLHSVRDGCLAGAAPMPALRELDLRRDREPSAGMTSWLLPDDLRWLARQPPLHSLQITGRAAQAALRTGNAVLSGLTELDRNVFDFSSLHVRAGHLASLHVHFLQWQWACLGPEHLIRALLPHAHLEVVRLDRIPRHLAGRALATLAGVPTLRTLALVEPSGIGERGRCALEASALRRLTGLTALAITSGLYLTPAQLRAVGQLTGLRHLRLSPGPGLRDADMEPLRRLRRLASLHVTLDRSALAALGRLRPLRELTCVAVCRGDMLQQPAMAADAVRAQVAGALALPVRCVVTPNLRERDGSLDAWLAQAGAAPWRAEGPLAELVEAAFARGG